MHSLPVPRKADDLSVAWLNAVMAGHCPQGASVRGFDTEVIGEGVGFLSDLVRLSLRWDRPEGCPQSLIAKFASSNLELREIIGSHKHYENEVHFYRELAADTPVRTPICYFVHNIPDTHDTLILLEDVSADAAVDQVQGCALDLAEQIVDALAKLHGFWWEHPRLGNFSWITRLSDPLYTQSLPEHFRKCSPVAVERLGDCVPDWYRGVQTRYASNLVAVMQGLYHHPLTLVHGDFRLDNVLLGTKDGQPVLTVIDWQMTMCGPGVYDLGYFFIQNLTVEDRRANEQDLLALYCDRLRQMGVQNIRPETLYETYRLVCLWCLVSPILHAATFDMDNARDAELTLCMAERAFAAVEDHNVLELLS